jgi:PEP-CTERM motif-containing protein
MRNSILKAVIAATALAAFFAPKASADQATAGMSLTSAGNNVYDNVFIGPYTATITPAGASNGTPTPVICDDFGDDSYVPETWTAYVTNETAITSDPTLLRFGSSTNYVLLYNEAAWLANQLISNTGGPTEADAIQAAIWNLLDPTDLASNTFGFSLPGGANCNKSGNQDDQAMCWEQMAATAEAKNTTTGVFSDVTIYSVDTGKPINCPSEPAGTCSAQNPPQEFMVVTTPEPSTILMLALGLGGLFLLKRRQRNSNSAPVLAA